MVTAEALLEVGADHTLCSSRGTTPLHAACYYAHESVVRALLRGGADGSVMDAGGMRPGESFSDKVRVLLLHMASECFSGKVGALLL
jgi:ankyrin repeat protein